MPLPPAENPYAAPSSPLAGLQPAPTPHTGPLPQGIFRQGKLLVFEHGIAFPDICLRTNQPTADRWERNLTWDPPWLLPTWLLLIVPMGLLGMRVAFVMGVFTMPLLLFFFRKSVQVSLPVSGPILRRRRIHYVVACFLLAWGCMMPVAEAFYRGWMFREAAVVLLVVGGLWMGLTQPMLSMANVDTKYVWLRGVHPDYLDRCPPTDVKPQP